MRVAIVTRAWFPNHQALLERVQSLLEKNGIELHYVLLAGPEAGRPWERSVGKPVPRFVAGMRFSVFGKEIMLNVGVKRVLDDIAPDVVVVSPWSEVGSFAAKLWAKRAGVPCIGWVMGIRTYHWTKIMAFRGFVTRLLVRQFVRGMNELFAYGDRVAIVVSEVTAFPLDRIVVVKHCVDEALYSFDSSAKKRTARETMRARFAIGKEEFVFGYIGQLSERKGFEILLEACRELWGEGYDFRLFVLGRGPSSHGLKLLSQQFPRRVAHLQRVESSELRHCYSMLDCVVIPSLFDDWSTVVNEAFCAGVPVIASEGAYVTWDLVRNGENGYVYSPERPGELSRCMRAAMKDREQLPQLGECGNALICGSWNMNISAGIWARQLTYWARQTTSKVRKK